MAEERVKRRLVAILAADVVSYSRLMGEDEAGTLAALKEHRTLVIDPKIARQDGRIVKLIGDGTLAAAPACVIDLTQRAKSPTVESQIRCEAQAPCSTPCALRWRQACSRQR